MIAEPTGTEGDRTIGRPWQASPSQSFSQVEMFSSPTDTRTVTCLIHLLFRNASQDRMLPIGKYPLLHGQSFFNALTRANR